MDGNAWDRQDKEPSLWFRRFERFRLAGPGRSMLAVYNAERRERAAKKDKAFKPAKSVSSAWRKRAGEWRWRERAEAWDLHEAARIRAEREAEEQRLREAAREVRQQLLSAGYNLLGKGVMPYMGGNAAQPSSQDLQRMLAAIVKFNEDSRAEYGDLPTQRLDVGGTMQVQQITADDMAAAAAAAADFETELLRGRTATDPDPDHA